MVSEQVLEHGVPAGGEVIRSTEVSGVTLGVSD